MDSDFRRGEAFHLARMRRLSDRGEGGGDLLEGRDKLTVVVIVLQGQIVFTNRRHKETGSARIWTSR